MSDVRSVLLLCWRDTGHPQGGGSETYLQRIGAQLAAADVDVTLRTARYPGEARPVREPSSACASIVLADGTRSACGRCWRWRWPGWPSVLRDGCDLTWSS